MTYDEPTIRHAIEVCEKVRADYHATMMQQKPGGKRALQFAHLSEGALACKAMLVMALSGSQQHSEGQKS